MASNFFKSMVPQVSAENDQEPGAPLTVSETLILTDTRNPSETVTQLSFKFNKPIPAGKVTQSQMLGELQELVSDGSLEVAERILAHMGLQQPRPAVNKTKSTRIQIGKTSRYRKEQGTKKGFRDGKGRFVSEINLRNAIQLASTNELVKDMKKNKTSSPKDVGLKFQTGRFANSMKIKPLSLKKDGTISIFYTYMVRPYSVFDPTNGNKLASAKRNPQYMIGKAISEALKQLGLSRYNVEIKQHRR